MKSKTEAKRQAILDEAAKAFQELGFEGTSMSEICARVGGSKMTLYNYFPSKDELFFAVMDRSCDAEYEAAHQAIDPRTDDIEKSIRNFGERFLAFLYMPEIQVNRHLAISVSGRTELGRLMYERRVLRSQQLIADFLQTAMDNKQLRRADPMLMTKQLCNLLEAELIDRFLFQQSIAVGKKEIKNYTARALRVFMAAYGPD